MKAVSHDCSNTVFSTMAIFYVIMSSYKYKRGECMSSESINPTFGMY